MLPQPRSCELLGAQNPSARVFHWPMLSPDAGSITGQPRTTVRGRWSPHSNEACSLDAPRSISGTAPVAQASLCATSAHIWSKLRLCKTPSVGLLCRRAGVADQTGMRGPISGRTTEPLCALEAASRRRDSKSMKPRAPAAAEQCRGRPEPQNLTANPRQRGVENSPFTWSNTQQALSNDRFKPLLLGLQQFAQPVQRPQASRRWDLLSEAAFAVLSILCWRLRRREWPSYTVRHA